ncbi:MAG: hypothetical protein DRI32_06490 [Chloroflexi bacterium]|nr:MAG: hypothetical protein DRI32_06490 [Chloroflexota bacterium]
MEPTAQEKLTVQATQPRTIREPHWVEGDYAKEGPEYVLQYWLETGGVVFRTLEGIRWPDICIVCGKTNNLRPKKIKTIPKSEKAKICAQCQRGVRIRRAEDNFFLMLAVFITILIMALIAALFRIESFPKGGVVFCCLFIPSFFIAAAIYNRFFLPMREKHLGAGQVSDDEIVVVKRRDNYYILLFSKKEIADSVRKVNGKFL